MNVKAFQCNPFCENCYVVWNDESNYCLIVDPGISCDEEWESLHHFLNEQHLTPQVILLTHCHSDHVMGSGRLTRAYPDLSVCGSMDDQNHLPPVVLQNQFFGVKADVQWSPISVDLKEGETLVFPTTMDSKIRQHRIEVLDCPGHSHHGLCYYFPDDKIIFTGDVLFFGSVGRSDFGMAMGCDGKLLIESIVQKLLTLPADVKVYPGHGPATTIGLEATYNPCF